MISTMRKLILRWILLAFSVVLASMVSQALGLHFNVDVSTADSVFKLFLGVAVLAFLNATIGRVLRFVTLPITCLTLGLFSLVVNAVVLMMASSLKLGFSIADGNTFMGFLAAFVASIMISSVNGILGVFLTDDKDD